MIEKWFYGLVFCFSFIKIVQFMYVQEHNHKSFDFTLRCKSVSICIAYSYFYASIHSVKKNWLKRYYKTKIFE